MRRRPASRQRLAYRTRGACVLRDRRVVHRCDRDRDRAIAGQLAVTGAERERVGSVVVGGGGVAELAVCVARCVGGPRADSALPTALAARAFCATGASFTAVTVIATMPSLVNSPS